MKKSAIAYKKLVSHEFIKVGLQNAVDISNYLYTGSITTVEAEYKRDPDEYEYYVIKVGRALSHLFGLCQQLIHGGIYLTSFSPSKRMKEVGISRANHLQYNIENYIIRTQSLHDRALKVVNAVFHLGLHPRDCRHSTISNNIHLLNTDVPKNLKSLQKLVERYRKDRNVVIHHSSYSEDDLRKLEMFYLVQEEDDEKQIDADQLELFQYASKDLTRSIVNQKIDEFDSFNELIFIQLASLFNNLKPKYKSQLTILSKKCGHPPNS